MNTEQTFREAMADERRADARALFFQLAAAAFRHFQEEFPRQIESSLARGRPLTDALRRLYFAPMATDAVFQ